MRLFYSMTDRNHGGIEALRAVPAQIPLAGSVGPGRGSEGGGVMAAE